MSKASEKPSVQENNTMSGSAKIDATSMEVENPYDPILDNNRAFILHCISKARDTQLKQNTTIEEDTNPASLHSYNGP
jgi:hypothetical protein